jgi:hypothetical protein
MIDNVSTKKILSVLRETLGASLVLHDTSLCAILKVFGFFFFCEKKMFLTITTFD